ncbi:MAG: winged helix DNA-binding domain-containing protein [bacterium]
MPNLELCRMRLSAQRIVGRGSASAAETVRWMGAIQAQDFGAAQWAIGLRTLGVTVSDIDSAIERREIIRTWPMRGTLHFISPELVRPVLRLCAPRVFQRSAARFRQLEIDDDVLKRARKLVAYHIREHGPRTRAELYAAFDADGLKPDGQRGIHILGQLSREAVLCHGSHRGKQPTFVLLDEWSPETAAMDDRGTLVELAARYFSSHGPATVHDFAWWSNLKVAEARSALEANKAELENVEFAGKQYWFSPAAVTETDGRMRLLPGFDEFVLGYTDRTPALSTEQMARIVPGDNGMFMPAVVDADGGVAGTWRRMLGKGSIRIEAQWFDEQPHGRAEELDGAAEEYAHFIQLPMTKA